MTIDGQLTGDYVQIAEKCCNQAIALGKRVHVFLRDVSIVDEAGCALLRRLAGLGCSLHGKGLYTSYIVQALRATVAPYTTTERGDISGHK